MASIIQTARGEDVVQLQSLPCELIEEIYVYSENLNMAATNQLFHQILSQEVPRLRVCSHVFSKAFTSSISYYDCNFSAKNQYDQNLVKLQNRLLNHLWFDTAFARSLEAITPVLQERAARRKPNFEDFSSVFLDPTMLDGNENNLGLRVTNRSVWSPEPPKNVHMPRRWLFGPWTGERVEIVDRLRSWYIGPATSRFPDSALLYPASQRAMAEGRDDMRNILDWCLSLEALRGGPFCLAAYTGIPLPSQAMQQWTKELAAVPPQPLPEDDDE